MLNDLYTKVEKQLNESCAHLADALKKISTGRANPAMIEGVMVEAYGTRQPLQQLASIMAPEPLSLVVEPWDKGLLKAIEQGLQESDLGINPANEGERLRIKFPPLSGERREELAKLVREKAEEARISVRAHRVDALKEIKNLELSEDEQFQAREKIQKFVEAANSVIDKTAETKEAELKNIA